MYTCHLYLGGAGDLLGLNLPGRGRLMSDVNSDAAPPRKKLTVRSMIALYMAV